MRFSSTSKICLLLILSGCAACLATLFLPRLYATVARPQDGALPQAEKATTSSSGKAKRAEANLGNAAGVRIVSLSECSLDKFSLAPVPGGVDVSANVTLMDTLPGCRYLWMLKVQNETRTATFIKRHYTDQAFTIEDVVEGGSPAFSERVELLPGTYKIQVSLLWIPAGFDLAKLKDEAIETLYTRVSGCDQVRVGK